MIISDFYDSIAAKEVNKASHDSRCHLLRDIMDEEIF